MACNSCGDRHCPTCSGAKRADWVESASELILAGVAYFQVVFTLPSDLSRLALGNRKKIYDLLFTRRWSLHMLPKGYTKTCRFGGWSNPCREVYLEQCAKQLDSIDARLSAEACGFGPFDAAADTLEPGSEFCPACDGKMIPQGQQ